ncbi:MAG: sigma-54 dependent transcriptional regulator, partial [Planctomycetales bacterium]|nr:sigma-54 dependent transcriptional regulator [Planctomycetales bacterium]
MGSPRGRLVGYVRELEARAHEQVESERRESSLLIGSPKMREVWDRIRRASRSNEIVLLRGESGTGKSFTARKIHDLSPRRERPYVEVGLTSDIGSENMIQSDLFGHEKGAFTGATEAKPGLFQLADGGTIFLDEIGDASSELQAKLLRVLEKGQFKRLGGGRDLQVDVRVIAATNRDLERLVKEGSFRQDLYYRLNVIPIELPPLRERPEDISALAEFLLARALARDKGSRRAFEPGLTGRLRAYAWPGNIRELDHAVKYALAMGDGDTVRLGEFPEVVRTAMGGGFVLPLATVAAALPAGPVGPGRAAPSAAAPPPGELVDVSGLRRVIRGSDPVLAGTHERPWEVPAHIDHAKRLWLATLIEEFAGDLGIIGKFWDRGSEKTLRNLVREYGLAEQLAAARARGKPSG